MSEFEVKRYCNFILKQCHQTYEEWNKGRRDDANVHFGGYYKFEGNFIGLMLGYLIPAIFASITMPYHWFWLAGITAPVCYALCEFNLAFTGRKTEMAEYAHGAMMFLLFFINIGGI